MPSIRRWALPACLVVACLTVSGAQMRVAPLDSDQGHVALGLALRHLGNTGIFMQATAHPDDEDNGLLVLLNRILGVRTALATATRGNGGQNEIGPEIFEALGVLRTEELAAAHRFDGAEQYFTRAVDFGYSFSLDETFEKWGREEITADYVRLIRTIRPDVIAGMSPDGRGGGQHHQASGVLSREAYKLAGDPSRYPEQLKEGLRPWQPRKYYSGMGFGRPSEGRSLSIDLSAYDPLLGRTPFEIGAEARSMHKCQGMPQLLPLPAPVTTRYRLVESTMPDELQRDERTLFDGVDTTIPGLAHFAGPQPPKELTDGLTAIAATVQTAQKNFLADDDASTLPPLLIGLQALRTLRTQLRMPGLDDTARYEIDFRLRQKEREFQEAILLASAVRIEALADDGVVVPGQPVKVSVVLANRGAGDVALRQVRFDGFEGAGECTMTAVAGGGMFGPRPPTAGTPAGPAMSIFRSNQAGRCETTLAIPASARVTEPYWRRDGEAGRYVFESDAPFGLPYRPSPFYVQVTLGFTGLRGPEEVTAGLPVQYRYEGNIFSGEKRSDLLVVPQFSVTASPGIAIVPSAAPSVRPTGAARDAAEGTPQTAAAPAGRRQDRPREVRVTIMNGAPGASEGLAVLDVPPGWTVTPPRQTVKFSREDEEQTLRFQVTPAARAAAGVYHVRASVLREGQRYARGYQVIEYPHIRRQHVYHEAASRMQIVDVKVAPDLTVGYVMGVGDEVPQAITQLGAKVELIGSDDLAWGNLSRFHTIVTGVRAYERRTDLRANNERLLRYVRDGGTLVVQYNKFEFNEAQYGPYPAKVSNNRVTDEEAPVTLLAPSHEVFTLPNRITDAAWRGWVQERGLYFLGERDSRYHDLVRLEDPFPYNAGEKGGALVETSYGKGRWLYVGLGLWRELPAGVDGAYQLLANLISLGKTSRAPAKQP